MSYETVAYEAKAFSPRAKGVTFSGKLSIDETNLNFLSETLSFAMPLAGMTYRSAGYNNAQIFFEHPDYPGTSIYTSDPRVTEDPILAQQPGFAPMAKKFVKGRKEVPLALIVLVAFGAGVLMLILAFILAKDPLVKFAANRIPIEWEQKLGDKILESLAAETPILTNSPHQGTINAITNRLLPTLGRTPYKFTFHIMEDSTVNAFALPGGHVVVLTGLLEEGATPEEIAGVLAHEIAHVTHRHNLRMLIERLGLAAFLQVVIGDMGVIFSEGSRVLLEQRFSRNHEREADNTGWDYLIAAKIDPRGLTEFFKKLIKIEEKMGLPDSDALALLNSHPATSERIAKLDEKWQQLSPKPAFVKIDAPVVKK